MNAPRRTTWSRPSRTADSMERSVHPSARRALRERTSGLSSGIEARGACFSIRRPRSMPSRAPRTSWRSWATRTCGEKLRAPSPIALAPSARPAAECTASDDERPCSRASRALGAKPMRSARSDISGVGGMPRSRAAAEIRSRERDVLRREPACGVGDERHAHRRIGDRDVGMMVRGLGELGDGGEQLRARWRSCGCGTRRPRRRSRAASRRRRAPRGTGLR